MIISVPIILNLMLKSCTSLYIELYCVLWILDWLWPGRDYITKRNPNICCTKC